MQPIDPDKHRQRQLRRLVIAGVAAVVIIIVLIFGVGYKNKNNQSTNRTSTSYDANSGETVRTIKGEHGNTGVPKGFPLFLGTDELLNAGLSSDQLSGVEMAFYDYSVAHYLNIQQVSVTAGSVSVRIVPTSSGSNSYMDFTVVLDSKTKDSASVQYDGLENIDLVLKDAAGTKVYDSGTISSSNSVGS